MSDLKDLLDDLRGNVDEGIVGTMWRTMTPGRQRKKRRARPRPKAPPAKRGIMRAQAAAAKRGHYGEEESLPSLIDDLMGEARGGDMDKRLKKGRNMVNHHIPKLYNAGEFEEALKMAKQAQSLMSFSHTDAGEARGLVADIQKAMKGFPSKEDRKRFVRSSLHRKLHVMKLRETSEFPGEILDEARDHKTMLVRDMKLKDGSVIKAGTKVKVNFPTHADQAKQAFFTLPGERKPKGLPSERLHMYFRGFSKPPSMGEVSKWLKAGMSKSLTGAVIKGDKAFHKSGVPSWLLVLGYL